MGLHAVSSEYNVLPSAFKAVDYPLYKVSMLTNRYRSACLLKAVALPIAWAATPVTITADIIIGIAETAFCSIAKDLKTAKNVAAKKIIACPIQQFSFAILPLAYSLAFCYVAPFTILLMLSSALFGATVGLCSGGGGGDGAPDYCVPLQKLSFYLSKKVTNNRISVFTNGGLPNFTFKFINTTSYTTYENAWKDPAPYDYFNRNYFSERLFVNTEILNQANRLRKKIPLNVFNMQDFKKVVCKYIENTHGILPREQVLRSNKTYQELLDELVEQFEEEPAPQQSSSSAPPPTYDMRTLI